MQIKSVNTIGVQEHNRLFVIGNGFDLAHGLPTRFDTDFKNIAVCNEADNRFWDLYPSESANIWSDFESLLAKPDFDELGAIFEQYPPDYLSDHESDRDSIILQADISGKLEKSLLDFATKAEKALLLTRPRYLYKNLFTNNALYVNFNYTHTLESLYGVPATQVLHIHGEVGGNRDLLLGYDASDFDAGNISEDVTGRGHYRSVPTEKYIDGIEDFYVSTAYKNLLLKIQSWAKPCQTGLLSNFVKDRSIDEIIVIGFSFGKVDAVYFNQLQQLYPTCKYIITAIDEQNAEEYNNKIMSCYSIHNYAIELL